MKMIKLNTKDFGTIMGYYSVQRDSGKFKYLFEIAVPNEFLNVFVSWMNLMESTKLEFSLWLIKRYDNYKLFYGFSDFCIREDLNLKLFYFNFESTNALYNKFYEWNIESELCFIPDTLAEYLENVKNNENE